MASKQCDTIKYNHKFIFLKLSLHSSSGGDFRNMFLNNGFGIILRISFVLYKTLRKFRCLLVSKSRDFLKLVVLMTT